MTFFYSLEEDEDDEDVEAVILFMMLSGRCPFGGETDKEIQEAVLGQALRFNQKHWGEISPDAIDLCQRMMERSVRNRLTCKGVLDHAWYRY